MQGIEVGVELGFQLFGLTAHLDQHTSEWIVLYQAESEMLGDHVFVFFVSGDFYCVFNQLLDFRIVLHAFS